MKVTVITKELELKRPFRISRGAKTTSQSVFVKVKRHGIEGWGEASPNPRYNETPASAMTALAIMLDSLPEDCLPYQHIIQHLHPESKGQYSAMAAVDTALMDYVGKYMGAPLYRLWGADPKRMPVTSYTLSIDSPEQVAEQAKDAVDFHALKLKLSGDGEHDRAMLAAVRTVTDKPVRVDANEAYTDREVAAREIEWMEENGVVLVEQPMPAAQVEDMRWLKIHSALPVYADESIVSEGAIPGLKDQFHGVNIKIQKCGGPNAALRAIGMARALNMKVMLGCMVESSLGIAAAAHMAPLADVVDLDGHLLIKNNPFNGIGFEDGRLILSEEPGLGLHPNREIMIPDEDDAFI